MKRVSPKGARLLISKHQLSRRLNFAARRIAALRPKPQTAVLVLAGAFVFGADLLRALAKRGLVPETDFLWLRSYGDDMRPAKVRVLAKSLKAVSGKSVLLIDGVLDSGATLVRAQRLLRDAGAKRILSVVAVSKAHPKRKIEADLALFRAEDAFLFGYGMDARGAGRGLPGIWAMAGEKTKGRGKHPAPR